MAPRRLNLCFILCVASGWIHISIVSKASLQLLMRSVIYCVQVDAERSYHQYAAEVLDKLYAEVRVSVLSANWNDMCLNINLCEQVMITNLFALSQIVQVKQHTGSRLNSTTVSDKRLRNDNEDAEYNKSGDLQENGQNSTYFVAEVRPST